MTESFEDVCASYDDCTWIGRNGVEAAISRLQKAHDHEIEQLRRSRFREGYEAGQRSMDAEHYAVALRLKHLPLDEDSHGNLSQIARAIWHSDFGWTKGACEALRDELVRLLGGVHEIESGGAASCACDADCDCHNQQPQTVAMYDELGNERHKAMCRLREWEPDEDGSSHRELWEAITGEKLPTVPLQGDAELDIKMRDRLIHLLGGDESNFIEIAKTINLGDECDGELMENSENHKIATTTDEPRAMDADGTSHIDDGTCPNDDPTSSITDELREFATDPLLGYASQELHVERITAIADRIDEQFDRCCELWERVAQDAIHAQLKAEEERDEARQECDNLLDLLRDAVVDFEYASYSWNYALIVGENITIETERNKLAKECDELRKSLREIAERVGVPHDVDLDEYGDDLVAKATLGKIDSTHEYIGALEWQRDRQRKLLDEYDKTHMELPVDANGESIHVGDIMEYAEGGKPKEVIAVSDTEAFLVDDGPRYSSLCVHHVPVDTAESIVRDIHLGKVTDSEAVERIRALNG